MSRGKHTPKQTGYAPEDGIAMPDDFDDMLAIALEKPNPGVKQAYICSPCSGTKQDVAINIKAAVLYMKVAREMFHIRAQAPHAVLPFMLSDVIPYEREMTLRIGLELLKYSQLLYVCGDTVSTDMRNDIKEAARLRIPIIVFSEDIRVEVHKIATQSGGRTVKIDGYPEYCPLALSPDEIVRLVGRKGL